LSQPATVTATATATLAYRRRWVILGVVLVGSFMAILDVFIVVQGLPSIRTSLGAGAADLELVVSAYSLVYAVFLITGGRLGDIIDRKRIFLSGMAVFTIASALAGYAPTPTFLIAARILQGLGAAFIYPQVLSTIQVTFDGKERALALSVFAAISGIGAIAGNIIGGFLIQLDLAGLSWRPIFLVNVPVGIVGLLIGWRVLQPSKALQAPRLDIPGVGLITLFLVSLILPLAEGQTLGWPTWTIALLFLSIPFLAAFVLYESRLTKRGGHPLVDIDLFQHRSFSIGVPVTILQYVYTSGTFFTLVIFLQVGLGFSPINSGIAFLQINIGFITASLLAPRLIPRFGTRIMSLGYAIQVIGLGWTLITINTYGIGLDLLELSLPLVVIGVGAGLQLSPLLGYIFSGVPREDVGAASGVVSTSMQVGNTVGISLLGLIFYSFLNSHAILTSTSYLSAFKSTVPFLMLPPLTAFLIITFLAQSRTRPMIERLDTSPRAVE
jgi:EmrB/QacA subfamily drug resistance transporter